MIRLRQDTVHVAMSAIIWVKAACFDRGVDSRSFHMNSSRCDGSWFSVTPPHPLELDLNSVPIECAVVDCAMRRMYHCARLNMYLDYRQECDSSSICH